MSINLSQNERDEIAVNRANGLSFRAIGVLLGRANSTISREYKRNLNEEGVYLPSTANKKSKQRKIEAGLTGSKCEPYADLIYKKLTIGWTPAQIAGRLTLEEKNYSVSYETIYNFIYKHRFEWAKLLPRKHEPRWLRGMGKKHTKREMIPNRTSILERPEANRRQIRVWSLGRRFYRVFAKQRIIECDGGAADTTRYD